MLAVFCMEILCGLLCVWSRTRWTMWTRGRQRGKERKEKAGSLHPTAQRKVWKYWDKEKSVRIMRKRKKSENYGRKCCRMSPQILLSCHLNFSLRVAGTKYGRTEREEIPEIAIDTDLRMFVGSVRSSLRTHALLQIRHLFSDFIHSKATVTKTTPICSSGQLTQQTKTKCIWSFEKTVPKA